MLDRFLCWLLGHQVPSAAADCYDRHGRLRHLMGFCPRCHGLVVARPRRAPPKATTKPTNNLLTT